MVQITVNSPEDAALCPIRNVLAMVSGKWQILILMELSEGPMRFSALKRQIGDITQRVLTENLRSLERDGFLVRHVDPGPPIKSTYSLTPLGEELSEKLMPLAAWAGACFEQVREHRADYDARSSN